jgi:hypothetical protein
MSAVVHHGDCLDVLATLADYSIDAVVTDPPYSLSFMGKSWDAHETPAGFQAWCQLWASECLRVLKPGGHLLAFGGTRTWHRLACAVEDAGFEVRDSIAWLYGSGFPKSLDVSKAIDKASGAERVVISEGKAVKRIIPGADQNKTGSWLKDNGRTYTPTETAAATPDAERWQGWGTALKPAFEPIVVARKPLVGTVAANVLAHGTGALNIGSTRIEHGSDVDLDRQQRQASETAGFGSGGMKSGHVQPLYAPAGRWPANVVLDESQAEALDEQSGTHRDGTAVNRNRDTAERTGGYDGGWRKPADDETYGGQGGASRFFFVAESDSSGVTPREPADVPQAFADVVAGTFLYTPKADASERVRVNGTAHPTVKPLALMRWLVRLVTPPGGTVLEPFAGSGTTVEACILEGFDCIAIEREAEYLPLIQQRIDRRRDPVAAVRATQDDGGLFDLLDGGAA